MNKKEMLNDIIKSNDEMLRHFTASSNALLQSVQDHQTELFEINIKLDELYRTKSVYSTPSSSRKNVFSPIIKQTDQDEKENELNTQINDLKLVKETLEAKIAEEEREIFVISEKLASLTSAKKAINNLGTFLDKYADDDEEEGFEFVEEDPEISEAAKHGTNILMLDAYDDTYNATILDSKVKADITSDIHRLDILSYLITSDPEPIEEYIMKELHRGATQLHGEGVYTHVGKTVLLTVVSRHEAVLLRDFIKENEPGAFMIITSSTEIIGNGFRGVT